MDSQYLTTHILPDAPGVYFFKKNKDILYIGKATSLRDRVRSYFSNDLIKTRGRLLVDMVTQATSISYEQTDSVLEAFILESELIKKHLPRFNTKEKDNKSFNYVVMTDEAFPRVLVVRGRNIEQEAIDFSYKYIYGPYPFGTELREAMKLIRRIFPYRDNTCTPLQGKPCFNRSIGLCPGVCTGEISEKEYKKQIKHLCMFFEGKKQRIVSALEKDMKAYAKSLQFEKAGEVKHTLQSLTHIQDISMMKKEKRLAVYRKNSQQIQTTEGGDELLVDDTDSTEIPFRMEAYDIAHMSGKNMVGVMVAMADGEFDKNFYRKFIINSVNSSNDTAALQEVLKRRFNHPEWPLPDVIVIDGGKAQINAAQKVIDQVRKQQEEVQHASGSNGDGAGLADIVWPTIISVVKDDRHKARQILNKELLTNLSSQIEDDIIRLNAEAHRFAITFHKKKRQENQGFLPKKKAL